MTFDTTRFHKTWFQEVTFIKIFQFVVRIQAVFDPLRSDSEPGVDTVGIYIENHYNECREFFILIRFDHRNLDEKGSLPHLREDASISETCHLEENASHNDPWMILRWFEDHQFSWFLIISHDFEWFLMMFFMIYMIYMISMISMICMISMIFIFFMIFMFFLWFLWVLWILWWCVWFVWVSWFFYDFYDFYDYFFVNCVIFMIIMISKIFMIFTIFMILKPKKSEKTSKWTKWILNYFPKNHVTSKHSKTSKIEFWSTFRNTIFQSLVASEPLKVNWHTSNFMT